jgi:hypothetical protein
MKIYVAKILEDQISSQLNSLRGPTFLLMEHVTGPVKIYCTSHYRDARLYTQ